MENESKITIDREEYQRFAVSDDQKTIEVGDKSNCDVAVVGYSNKVSTSGEQTHTAISGYEDALDVNANSCYTAVSGDLASLTVNANYDCTALAGDDGQIYLNGTTSTTAISGRQSCIDVAGFNHRIAISDDGEVHVNVTGHDNEIVVACDYAVIECSGTRNTVTCLAINATFRGVNGNRISLADYNDNCKFIGFVTGRVSKNGLKKNVKYTVERGRFVEVKPRGCSISEVTE